ncbi:glycosyltransferase family 4 protein [Vibrio variabilis]|uniref:glycosyltransferase family 4 protein n=1 Tax=Vibrio variabilis TaxID=990271 RepID=UPI000DD9A386|nr:glycosyltransferase family 4 protein [Vibrio variabilis]
MKFVHFITRSDTIGGAQKYILETSKQLLDDGHSVSVVAGGSGPLSERAERLGMDYISLPNLVREISPLADLKCLFTIRREILACKPDVVLIHSAKAGLLGRLALLLTGCRVIFIAHGWSNIRVATGLGRVFYSKMEQFLSLCCYRVVCISEEDTKFATRQLGISPGKLSLIYNGVRQPEERVERLPESSTLRMLTVTRFQAPKDFDTLLASLVKISSLNWTLTVLGEGPELETYRQRIEALGLKGKISILGFKTDLAPYYCSHDLVLLVSNSEGLPLSLIEAMSFKKPVVATAVGGIPELIEEGINGYLIPDKDSEHLAFCLSKLCQMSATELSELGEHSYQRYKAKFSFDLMMSRLYNLCQS